MSIEKTTQKNLYCKYCHKKLEYATCPKKQTAEFEYLLPDIVAIPILIIKAIAKLINGNFKSSNEKVVKLTCTNKDCINYLNPCFGEDINK